MQPTEHPSSHPPLQWSLKDIKTWKALSGVSVWSVRSGLLYSEEEDVFPHLRLALDMTPMTQLWTHSLSPRIWDSRGLVTQLQHCCVFKQLLARATSWLFQQQFQLLLSRLLFCCSRIPNPNPAPLSRGQTHSHPRLSLWMWGHLNLSRSGVEELNEYPLSCGQITVSLIHLPPLPFL